MYWRTQWLLPLLAAQIVMLASAQTAPNKVGVVSIRDAIASTADGKKAIQELDARFAPKRKDIQRQQESIQALQSQLQKGGSVLSEEQKRKLMADIDQQTKTLNRDVEDANAEVEQEQSKVLQTLGQKMMAVIDKYAKAKGFAVILDVSSQDTPILFAANEVELTKEIIDAYDKEHAPPPAAAAPAPAAPKPAAIPPAKKP